MQMYSEGSFCFSCDLCRLNEKKKNKMLREFEMPPAKKYGGNGIFSLPIAEQRWHWSMKAAFTEASDSTDSSASYFCVGDGRILHVRSWIQTYSDALHIDDPWQCGCSCIAGCLPTTAPEEHGARSLDADVNQVEEPNRGNDTLAGNLAPECLDFSLKMSQLWCRVFLITNRCKTK